MSLRSLASIITRCETMLSGPDQSTAIGVLADLLSGGFTVMSALEAWPLHSVPSLRGELEGIARRTRLGAPPARAVLGLTSFEREDVHALTAALALHRDHGGDLVAVLRALKRSMTERRERTTAARAAVAGVITSGRMVAGLPLVMLLLLPAARVPLLDTAGILAMATGILLAIVGMRWMSRLVPAPVADPPAAAAADRMATLLEGGLPLTEAAAACVSHPPDGLACELEHAQRRVVLGCSWADALAHSDDASLARLGSRLLNSQRLGVPAAGALKAAADSQRRDADTAFETALRRAPVLMVVPLVICVLPSFCLIGLVPFMRAFSLR